MRFIVALASVLAAMSSTAAAARGTAEADVLEAWRVADCGVIAAAIATMDPAEVWKQQTLHYKEHFAGALKPLYVEVGPPVPGHDVRPACPAIPGVGPVADGGRFEAPFWAADYSRVLLKIQLSPSDPDAVSEGRRAGRWRAFLLVRDAGGWRVDRTVDVPSVFDPWTAEEIS